MQRYTVSYSHQAKEDLKDITKYIAQDNFEKAMDYALKLQEKIKQALSIFPDKYPKKWGSRVVPF